MKAKYWNMKYLITHVMLLTALMCSVLQLKGQGWIKDYPFLDYDEMIGLKTAPDGGVFMLSRNATGGGVVRLSDRLTKTDPNGVVDWDSILNPVGPGVNRMATSLAVSDTGLIIGGIEWDSSATFYQGNYLESRNLFGQLLWRKFYDLGTMHPILEQVPTGWVMAAAPAVASSYPLLTYVNQVGDTLFTYRAIPNSFLTVEGIAVLPDGSIAISGYTDATYPGADTTLFGKKKGCYLARFDLGGNMLWSKVVDSTFTVFNLSVMDDGLVFAPVNSPPDGKGMKIYRFDDLGNLLWLKNYDSLIYAGVFTGLAPTQEGGLIAAAMGGYWTDSVMVMRLDAAGEIEWTQGLEGVFTAELWYPLTTTGLHDCIFLCGVPNFTEDLRLAGLDSLGNITTNRLHGEVYQDDNGNCVRDAGEHGLASVPIVADGPETLLAATDLAGFYGLDTDTGAYVVTPYLPYPYLKVSSCGTLPGIVNFSSPYDTLAVDFPMEPSILCPGMTVSFTHTPLRRCMPSTYHVDYCNLGTTGDSAVVVMEMDPHMTVTSSSIPWELPVIGNTYVFDVGYLNPGDCGSLDIFITLSCDTAVVKLGQAHCVEAHIYPDTLCTPPDPLWDGASITLEGFCTPAEDSVKFIIRNEGTAITATPGNVIVLEDNLMRMNTNESIAPGDSIIIAYAANGSTWTCAAQQSPFHPGMDNPMVSIEGCGVNAFGTFSVGFMNLLPQNDADPWIDIDCDQNVAAYDPNLKEAMPTGRGPLHLIQDSDLLEYTVHFQNTGTDTAFKVVVRDTLSPHLDPATIVPGAASHPYTFRLYGYNIAEWTFDNILLPDSNVNEPASHGVFEFTIHQQPGNPMGTQIPNGVSIWFDFNAPVPTDIVLRTIGEEVWGMISMDPAQGSTAPQVTAWPNPSIEAVNFRMESGTPPLTLILTDLNGRTLRTLQADAQQLTLERGNLPAGTYLFLLTDAKGNRGTGKLVLY